MTASTASALTLVSTHVAATTYHFQTDDPGWKSWALCTVNDTTGELLITSDWGNWTFRWNVQHLGLPTLTEFIAEREAVDYLACKLQGRHGGQRFSPEKTVATFRRALCEQRLQLRWTRRGAEGPALTRHKAREIWNALDDLIEDSGNSADLFLVGLSEIDGFDLHVNDRAFESLEYEQTAEDRALRDLILPALVKACAETTRARRQV